MAFPNKFPGLCHRCHVNVPAFRGKCVKVNGAYRAECSTTCEAREAPQPLPRTVVGDLGGIMRLFDIAATHLKKPAIELGVLKLDADEGGNLVSWNKDIRVHVATDRAKYPGSLTLLTADTFDTGKEYPERKWLGRLHVDGTLELTRSLDPDYARDIAARLKAFAADPSKVGAADGKLTGRCCFCRKSLTAEKSTAVGYGEKCASNFGLAWGAKPAAFCAAA